MPDNFDDKQIDKMSIDEINELFKDVIEMPDEYKIGGACVNLSNGGFQNK